MLVGFEILTAVVMENSVVWDITPCSPLKANRRFGGTCRLDLQDSRISHPRTEHEACSKFCHELPINNCLLPALCWFLGS
jgi:hypothetical protein